MDKEAAGVISDQDAWRQALAMKRNDRAAFDAAKGAQATWDEWRPKLAAMPGAK